MGSLFLPELGLDCRYSSKACVPKPIGRFLADVSKIHCDSEKISKLEDFVNRLQEEMMKIDGLKRELPLCMELLRDAISAITEELGRCSVPVFEEFIPLKKTCSEGKDDKGKGKGEDNRDKMNWMRSVQLWNADKPPPSLKVEKGKEEVKINLFESGKKIVCNFGVGKDELPVPGLSLCTPGMKNSIKHVGFSLKSSFSRTGPGATNIQLQTETGGRKQRRCWSAELHRQFTDALEHLGGPLVATPKQIREHMQVNGLTNDEVKSHLQKFRAHMKRKSNSNSQTAGFWSECGEFRNNSPDGPLQLSDQDESCSSNIHK